MTAKSFVMLVGILILFSNLSTAQLDEALKAHGSIEKFRQFGTLEFDIRDWPFGPNNGLVSDHHLVDLKSRKILVAGKNYKIGFDGKDAWSTPKNPPLAVPPRFYVSTPFYFFGMPFVLADPGAEQTPLGKKSLNGKQYDAVKVTFKKGVGDTSDDYYIPYFDPNTHKMYLAQYIVTYLPFRQGKSVDQMELHSIVVDEWQEVSGLVVPKKLSFHPWENGKLGKGSNPMTVENVVFRKERPDPKVFQKPEGAFVDESHKATK